MGLLKTLLLASSSGGGMLIEIWEYPNVFSDYNLCSLSVLSVTCSPASIVTMSLLTIELTSSPTNVAPALCSQLNSSQISTPASVVGLSKVVT